MKININQDTFIILTIILVALIAFGIGRLSAPKGEPVLIEGLQKASVEDIKGEQPASAEATAGEGGVSYEGRVLGSKNSDTH